MLATSLLTFGGMTVDDVAVRMGFAEASSFARAYKRWTGRNPGAARRGFDGADGAVSELVRFGSGSVVAGSAAFP